MISTQKVVEDESKNLHDLGEISAAAVVDTPKLDMAIPATSTLAGLRLLI